jgi:hypothetical protein
LVNESLARVARDDRVDGDRRRHWRGVRVRAFTDGAFDDGDGVVRTATASTWM